MKSTVTSILFILFCSIQTDAQYPVFTENIISQTQLGMQTECSVPRMIASEGGIYSICWNAYNSAITETNVNYATNGQLGLWSVIPDVFGQPTRNASIEVHNGWEYILATNPDSGLIICKRQGFAGSWTNFPVGTYNLYTGQNDDWGRFAVGGSNGETIHLITNSQGTDTLPVLDQNGPLTYSRSTDGGLTWNIDHVRLPFSDENYFLGFNKGNYAIDCRGDTVAIVAGGFDADLCLWKSVDNGTTWTKSVVFPFLVPLYDADTMMLDTNSDGIPDTVETSGQDPTVIVDKNGLIHVAFGRMTIYDSSIVDKAIYNPYIDGLYYWNENMLSPSIVANAEDYNWNGVIDLPTPAIPNTPAVGAYFGGITLQPSLASANNNRIYLSYSSVNEIADTAIYQCAHRHVYVIASENQGVSWSSPNNAVPLNPMGDGEYQEAVFASLVKYVTPQPFCFDLPLVYFRDGAPYCANGFLPGSPSLDQEYWNADGQGIPFAVDVVFTNFGCWESIEEHENVELKSWPNPVLSSFKLKGIDAKSESIALKIYSIEGKLMKELFLQNIDESIDVSDQENGIYICSVNINDAVYSLKLVVSK